MIYFSFKQFGHQSNPTQQPTLCQPSVAPPVTKCANIDHRRTFDRCVFPLCSYCRKRILLNCFWRSPHLQWQSWRCAPQANVWSALQHQREDHQRRHCRGDEEWRKERGGHPPKGCEWGQSPINRWPEKHTADDSECTSELVFTWRSFDISASL